MSEEKRFHARLFWLQSSARTVFQTHRVGVCCRVTVPKRKVQIWGDVSKKRAKYRNVIRCASIWHCPVCANNITAHRRDEISTVISAFREITLPVMISMTISHNSKDSLQTTLGRLCAAWRSMTECRSWAVNSDEYRGYVKSLEITWGKVNGWHPHFHALFFIEVETCLTDFYNRIKSSWGNAVEANGGAWTPQAMHMTTTDESVAGYIAKFGHEPLEDTRERLNNWGHSAELTRGGMKQGKRNSLTPFDMLELFLTDKSKRSLWFALLKEYGDTMVGQRQITWSRNPDMRKEAGVKKDLGDNEIVEGIEAGYYLLATIEPEQWSAILWANMQGSILDCAARGDNSMMQGIIHDCMCEHIKSINDRADAILENIVSR